MSADFETTSAASERQVLGTDGSKVRSQAPIEVPGFECCQKPGERADDPWIAWVVRFGCGLSFGFGILACCDCIDFRRFGLGNKLLGFGALNVIRFEGALVGYARRGFICGFADVGLGDRRWI